MVSLLVMLEGLPRTGRVLMSLRAIINGKGMGTLGYSCPLPALFALNIELFDAADDAYLVIFFGIFNKFNGTSALEGSTWKSSAW